MSYLKQFKDRVAQAKVNAVSAGRVPPLIPGKTDEKIERNPDLDSHHIRVRGGIQDRIPTDEGGGYPAKTA
jgi:hypothetical protein